MSLLMDATTALTAANVLLLLSIVYVHAKNLSSTRTTFTVGLTVFALLFLAENIVSLYYFATMMPYYAPQVEVHVFALKLLSALAFAVMNWLTWK